MDWSERVWQRSVEFFGEFMEPLVGGLGRQERREGAALYVQGLLLPGGRKSVEPMAQRLGVDKQKLQQFVSDSPWESQALWEAVRAEIVPVLGPIDSWIVDETGSELLTRHSPTRSRAISGLLRNTTSSGMPVRRRRCPSLIQAWGKKSLAAMGSAASPLLKAM